MKQTKLKSVRHFRAGRFYFFCLLGVAALSSCHRMEPPTRLFGEAQGTYYSISYYDPQHRDLQPMVDSMLDEFDQTASLWVENSLLRRINSNATDTVNAIFADMLAKSQQICDYTGGAFDCRIGRLVQAWGFSFKERTEPDSASLNSLLAAARGSVGVVNGRLVKQYAETELDFNAIAQGYSVDLLAEMFDSLGVHNYLIDVGGEVIGRGGKPDGTPWRVGIEKPAERHDSDPIVQTAVSLRDCSIVTSGSYRKYYEKEGTRYSHTIDPTTGRPVEHTLVSASVIEETAWLADAMATAYMAMGLERGLQFISDHPEGPGTAAVLLMYYSGDTLKTYATPQFEALQNQR